eukprot:1154045-Pelagomonas_calceolata.AAC.1
MQSGHPPAAFGGQHRCAQPSQGKTQRAGGCAERMQHPMRCAAWQKAKALAFKLPGLQGGELLGAWQWKAGEGKSRCPGAWQPSRSQLALFLAFS